MTGGDWSTLGPSEQISSVHDVLRAEGAAAERERIAKALERDAERFDEMKDQATGDLRMTLIDQADYARHIAAMMQEGLFPPSEIKE